MTDSMVERVAKALCDAACEDWDAASYLDTANGCEPEEMRDHWRMMARAAIEAMRIPSAKMLKAACKSMSPERRPTPDRVTVKAKHGIRYRAMIDAALEEGKQ